jgi:hypothetical protein
MMQLQIPPNAQPGMTINVALSDGRTVGIQVPPGAAPGSVIQFQVPPVQQHQFQQPQLAQMQALQQQQQALQRQQQQKAQQRQPVQTQPKPTLQQKQHNRTYQQRQEQQSNIQHVRESQANRNSTHLDSFEMIPLSNRSSTSGYGHTYNDPVYENPHGTGNPDLDSIRICCCIGENDMKQMDSCGLIRTIYCCGAAACCGILPCYSQVLTYIKEDEVGIIERLGKFHRVAMPGPVLLDSKCMVDLETVVTRMPTRLKQLVVSSETKTKDNVFCTVEISLQYGLDNNNKAQAAEAAHYKVENISQFITDQINDIIRSKLSKVELDHAFVLKNELQAEVESRLGEVLVEYGLVVTKALVTNFMPAKAVVKEMNNIYTQKLTKAINEQMAETQKMIEVTIAEGEAERKELLGKGTSLMRRAYLQGMQECLDQFVESMESEDFVLSWEDVLHMQLLLQYFDTSYELSQVSIDSNLYLSLDPQMVQEVKARLNVGHERTAADGPKKERKPKPEPDVSVGRQTRLGSLTKSPKPLSKLPPPSRRPSQQNSSSRGASSSSNEASNATSL